MADEVYDAFLESMRDLEQFRIDYLHEHQGPGLQRDDPDLRRLIESLAFFSARTHIASARQLRSMQEETTRRLFPALAAPVPAMGVVCAVPNRRLYESHRVPRGSSVVLSDGEHETTFTTMADVKVLPVTQGVLSRKILPDGNTRWSLPFRGAFPSTEDLGSFPLYINYVDDFQSSLRIFEALRENLIDAHIEFSGGDMAKSELITASVDFDGWQAEASALADGPIESERWWFQLPQQDLVLKFKTPAPPPGWQSFTIHFDIGQSWPRDLHLSSDVFLPFATPVINQTRCYADPVVWDGTSDTFTLCHPDGSGYQLHTLKGVYRVDGGDMSPLYNGVFGSETGSYLLQESRRAGAAGTYQLSINLPESFMDPVTISSDVVWYQPGFARLKSRGQSVALASGKIPGTTWQILGDMVSQDVVRLGQREEATELFVLNNKSFINKSELILLLELLGTPWAGRFAPLRDLISEVRTERQPMTSDDDSATSMIVYNIVFDDPSETIAPLVEIFARHLENFLDCWCSEAAIVVRATVTT